MTNSKSGEEYARQAARLLGHASPESIDIPGDIDRMARVAHALLLEYHQGYEQAWDDAHKALGESFKKIVKIVKNDA